MWWSEGAARRDEKNRRNKQVSLVSGMVGNFPLKLSRWIIGTCFVNIPLWLARFCKQKQVGQVEPNRA
jgi:hypothetical protein